MPNNYFQFKQFTIQQDKCAMKVCTDACIFGAYIANYLTTKKIINCLDIGTGTGLLSLMVAQKINTTIDAVELNNEAYNQAKENVENSNFKNSIVVHNKNITEFKPNKKYDFILSNPPFFEGDLKAEQKNKNEAKHNESLTLEQLLQSIKHLITPTGKFAVLLPFHRLVKFEKMANALHFYVQNELLIKQTTTHNYFRGIHIYSSTKKEKHTNTLTIKDENNEYTQQFIELLKDYYLHL